MVNTHLFRKALGLRVTFHWVHAICVLKLSICWITL